MEAAQAGVEAADLGGAEAAPQALPDVLTCVPLVRPEEHTVDPSVRPEERTAVPSVCPVGAVVETQTHEVEGTDPVGAQEPEVSPDALALVVVRGEGSGSDPWFSERPADLPVVERDPVDDTGVPDWFLKSAREEEKAWDAQWRLGVSLEEKLSEVIEQHRTEGAKLHNVSTLFLF
jgi:hypothetical protein